ncbi:hypothetical protein J7438_02395 [Thalassotalea sp. G20_0]|uniref:hypothetical protein n=1 Tax=Thalassotalea sp. G20_0 TaxID=2821093 RepID=UPI001ADA11F3|nr:hypothetical protein [Thalassotalea sp. G20_0]MBO9492942.1 hypothetical protein [Thalassotalea sp. G20_0]
MTIYTPGMRIICRDAEWLVTRVRPANRLQDQVIDCERVDDLTRGHEATFLTQLETIKELNLRS